MKKEPKTEASGDLLTEPKTKKKHQIPHSRIAAITQLIPSLISKPPVQPQSLAGAMAQIASTTTLTDSMVARTLGTGVSQRGNTTSAEGILRTLFPT